ncbi:MAG: hypothetical protein F6J98_02150 [Moorea sp. SIO4G2]|nr:hypothetical protein [Moorena sp. SIO4G2]
MIHFNSLELWISEQLHALRSQMGQAGIPVALLPLEAQAFSNERFCSISIAVSQVTGQEPPDRFSTQSVTYRILITLRLPNRYESNGNVERKNIESATEGILMSLIAKKPNLPQITKGIWLSSYSLLQPEGGNWVANLDLRFSRILSRKSSEENKDDLSRLFYEVLGSEDPEDLEVRNELKLSNKQEE